MCHSTLQHNIHREGCRSIMLVETQETSPDKNDELEEPEELDERKRKELWEQYRSLSLCACSSAFGFWNMRSSRRSKSSSKAMISFIVSSIRRYGIVPEMRPLALIKDAMEMYGHWDVKLPILVTAESSQEQSTWKVEGEAECAVVSYALEREGRAT